MGPLCPCPNSIKSLWKKVPWASHGAPYWDLGQLGAVPQIFPNDQSAPD
ncbi:unnamed protein product [Staurois parvus]|uniref:Uncharacterized protein n=1 Tax=Staurois parvus TaxID=386267 RepID=A0ABN9C764_9NEOB|nr:unnamed protein product [Staurois parvus]